MVMSKKSGSTMKKKNGLSVERWSLALGSLPLDQLGGKGRDRWRREDSTETLLHKWGQGLFCVTNRKQRIRYRASLRGAVTIPG